VTKSDPFDPELYSGSLPADIGQTEEKQQKARAGHAPGFILIPVQVRVRLGGVSAIAWATMACLLDLEFAAWVKGEPRTLSNKALAYFGVSRDLKRKGRADKARACHIHPRRPGKSAR
jgi:hypothetical protein